LALLRDACWDASTCPRHRFAPQRWLQRLRHTREQLEATLAVVDFDTEPRGHPALIRFDFLYERALSTRHQRMGRATDALIVPGLLSAALRLDGGANEHRCQCAHCDLARTFDEMRRGASEEDRAELDEAENAEHFRLDSQHIPWQCYEKDRGLANGAHREMFP
jgi:hypothetical protein